VSHPVKTAIHCINPDCPRPYPQTWGNKFCNSCGSPLQLKDRYIPLQWLGSGGFATIYTVWDLKAQTERVLKVLVEPSPKARTLFEQEADVLASLQHPGVPRVEADGYFQLCLGNPQQRQLPCLVMEKINGQTLQEILEHHPHGCPEAWVLNWLNQAVEILRELHSSQIIHRDLKPSNLMLRDSTRQLVMIDFGGAKQFGPAPSRSQASSTRLFSSGYSPPEQIAGGAVGPSADFYALGRTMIELLTGKYSPDLEDPLTGELRWRTLATVNPLLGNLLDEMTRENVRQRPASATEIQARLLKISQNKVKPAFSQSITQLARTAWNWPWVGLAKLAEGIAAFSKGLSQTTLFLLRVIVNLLRACLDTIWGMVLGAIGACVGTSSGFVLAYWSPVGAKVGGFVSQYLPGLVPHSQIALGSEMLVFAAAGLGTALGLTAAGGFGQRRRYLVAALMGLVGYGLGWLVWLAAPYTGVAGMAGLIAVAVALLTLGLGLPSYYLVHAVVAGAGTTTVFASLVSLKIFSAALFHLYPQASWLELLVCIAFFGFVSVTLSFWLGVSYYLVVPFLRFLGWR